MITRVLVGGLLTYRLTELLGWEDGPFRLLARLREAIGLELAATYAADGSVECEEWVATNELAEMVACPRCLSVWAGWLSALLLGVATGDLTLAFLLEGLAMSGLAVTLMEWGKKES